MNKENKKEIKTEQNEIQIHINAETHKCSLFNRKLVVIEIYFVYDFVYVARVYTLASTVDRSCNIV